MQNDPFPDMIASRTFPGSIWKPIPESWTEEDGWSWALHTPEGVVKSWDKVPLPKDSFQNASARLEAWIGFTMGLDTFTPLLTLDEVKTAQYKHPEGEYTTKSAFDDDWAFVPHHQPHSTVGLVQHHKTKHTMAVFLDGVGSYKMPVMVALTKTNEEKTEALA